MVLASPDELEAAADEDLEDLFENAPCGYLIADPAGRIVKLNQTLADWLGRDRDGVVGKKISDLLNIAGKIYYETHFAPLLRMQGFFNEVALDFTRPEGGTFPALVNAVERRTATGDARFIRMTVFNATDRRRYERELLDARRTAEAAGAELAELNRTLELRITEAVEQRMVAEETLRQSQKMEAIGQLTGGVAHDFNNLLTIILGGLETAGRQIDKLPEEPRERIERALAMSAQGAKRAASLTARLLAFSRRQPLDPRVLDPNRLVTGLADLLQRTLGETIGLQTVSGAGVWKALADPGELEHALVNLAVIARDAMPDGGRLTIETTNAYLDEDYVNGFDEPIAPGQYVLIAVTDTGVGMDEETVGKVFEPFFTTKPVGQGTGLGLSQVYGFVRQSGGHIRIYSELGVGTSIKLYLPRAEAGQRLTEDFDKVEAAPVHGRGETILVVEDDETLRGYSSGLLREFGYTVISAGNGPEALRVLDSDRGIDLLFTDVVLPEGMDGRRLADAARLRRPTLKVLFTTGYTRNAIIHNGRLDSGVQLVSKPFSSSALAAKVRQVLDAGV